jgi:hypothetical protein
MSLVPRRVCVERWVDLSSAADNSILEATYETMMAEPAPPTDARRRFSPKQERPNRVWSIRESKP